MVCCLMASNHYLITYQGLMLLMCFTFLAFKFCIFHSTLHRIYDEKTFQNLFAQSPVSLTLGCQGCFCLILWRIVCILMEISSAFVASAPVNNESALVPIMAWHQAGDKPLPELMMTQSQGPDIFMIKEILWTQQRDVWMWVIALTHWPLGDSIDISDE